MQQKEPSYLNDRAGDHQRHESNCDSCEKVFDVCHYQHLPFVLFQRSDVPGLQLAVEILASLALFVGHAQLGIYALAVLDAPVVWVLKMRAVLAKIADALEVEFVRDTVHDVLDFRVSDNC